MTQKETQIKENEQQVEENRIALLEGKNVRSKTIGKTVNWAESQNVFGKP